MAFVSITRLRLRSWRYAPFFFVQAIRSARQAKGAPGSLGVTILREPGNIFWTRTVWDAESSMKAFMLSGSHRGVMHSLLEWCDEAAVAHWTQDSSEPPAWSEARAQLLRIGRPSKVNHPSEAQRQYQIAEPRLTPGGEVRWK
jgi:heme-degrading monooxygenase HmoA